MSRGRGPATGSPSTSTLPVVGASSPPTTLSNVLFPHPDGPIRHSSSPRATSSEVSSKARTLRACPSAPKRCDTLRMLIAGIIGSGAAMSLGSPPPAREPRGGEGLGSGGAACAEQAVAPDRKLRAGVASPPLAPPLRGVARPSPPTGGRVADARHHHPGDT